MTNPDDIASFDASGVGLHVGAYIDHDGDPQHPDKPDSDDRRRRGTSRIPIPFAPTSPRLPGTNTPPPGRPPSEPSSPPPAAAGPTAPGPAAPTPDAPAVGPIPVPTTTTPGISAPPSMQLNTPFGSLSAQLPSPPQFPPMPQLPQLNPEQISTLTSLAPAVLSAATALPSALLGAAMNVMGALTMMRNRFGSGVPYDGDPSTIPADQLYGSLPDGIDTGNWSGQATDAYAGTSGDQTDTATAIIELDRQLHAILEHSAGNARDGRQKIDAIIDKADAALMTLAPVASSVAGQAAIVNVISQAVQQGNAVVAAGLANSQANAAAVTGLTSPRTRTRQAQLVSARIPPRHHRGKRPTPRNVDEAIDAALDHLGITDPRARVHWKAGYRTLIDRESGNNPGAVNRVDSNAAAGHPSQGLTQTIPGTFNAFHVGGTSSDITDPTANVAASMNYVMHHYHVSPDGSDLAAKVQQADPHRAPKGY